MKEKKNIYDEGREGREERKCRAMTEERNETGRKSEEEEEEQSSKGRKNRQRRRRRRREEEKEDAAHMSILNTCSELSRLVNPKQSDELKGTRDISRLKLRNELVNAELPTSAQVIILIELR